MKTETDIVDLGFINIKLIKKGLSRYDDELFIYLNHLLVTVGIWGQKDILKLRDFLNKHYPKSEVR